MNEQDELDRLMRQPVPPPSDSAKQRALKASMRAFQQTVEKKSEPHQGNAQGARLTWTQQLGRSMDMLFSKAGFKYQYWISGASTCALAVIAFIWLQQPKDKPIVVPEPALQTAKVEKRQAQTTSGNGEYDVITAEDLSELDPALDVSALQRNADVAEEMVMSDAAIPTSVAPAARPEATAMSQKQARMLSKSLPAPPPQDIAKPIQPAYRDRFESPDENAVKQVSEHPISTFSIDVDTASYSFVRRMLNQGQLPQKSAVRIEEMLNYFDYDYPKPDNKAQAFEPSVTVLPSPWKPGNKLVHIAIQGYDISATQQPDSNLVFLLDVSGSMNAPDKLPLVKQSMELLLSQLKPSDTVGIVVYAGAAGTVLEPTKVANKQTILAALNRLQAGGSTAGGEGLALAYQLAEAHFKKDAVNRILLATDGDFNVGPTADTDLQTFVERKRQSGIYLSVLGFGQGNYQDALMQKLAQNGNGIAAYIDTLGEAQKVLVNEATSALFPIAQDVKIQVEFNPATVQEYRLIGYETRALKKEDFNNDKVDAGDIGAGHTVTALYEITPVGSDQALVDPSRYAQNKQANSKQNSGEYGFLKIRYKKPQEMQSQLITRAIPVTTVTSEKLLKEAQFSVAVAGFAQILRNSVYGDNQVFGYDDVIALAQNNKGKDLYGYRTEFIQLVRKAKIAKAL